MSTTNLDKIFRPRSVVVVGASDNPAKVGCPVLRNLVRSGFDGEVYAVNGKRPEVQGIAAYASVSKLPRVPELAVLCTPAATIPGLIRECGEAGIRGVVILSAGFREAGAEGARLEAQVAAEAQRFPGLRIIGPNCLGVIVPPLNLNASFAAGMPQAGRVAFISQSGALGTAVLDRALEVEVGFSAVVSVGNMVEATFGDLIDYFARDPQTDALLLYIESITHAEAFLAAAREFSRTKPIIVYKAGRFAETARAASSHTGALVGEDAVYDAAFQQAGMERVFEFEDLFDCAELLARQRTLCGGRLAVVTNAGGPGIMATDALLECRGELAPLSEATLHELDALLPAAWPDANPIDILGDAPPERFGAATRLVLADPEVDALLVILTPQAMTDPTAAARAVAESAAQSSKPVLAAWMGGPSVREGVRLLNHAGIATFSTPEQAVRAFMHLVSHACRLDVLCESAGTRAPAPEIDSRRIGELLAGARSGETLSEPVSKAILQACGIPVTETRVARTAAEAVQIARKLEYPVALKVYSPQITHKTDVNGVVLNVQDDAGVEEGFRRIAAEMRSRRPDAVLEGVTVQRMVSTGGATELILGAKRDPTFGPVVMAGMGGVAAEVLRDRALGLAPLDVRQARRMLESLRSWALLKGYRGRPGVHLDGLTDALVRLSVLAAAHPEIAEIDVNPLLATAEGIMALDARMVLG